jgi:RNA polymerase sigma-70 factor, ECF subfamily
VLGFSAREVAESLDTTVASANSALQRARKTVDERFPEQSQQATLRSLGDQRLKGVVEGYMDAMARGDVDAVVSMLAEDAAWSMPPLTAWFRGRDGIRGFLVAGPLSGEFRWRHLPAQVNGQVASAAYSWVEAEQAWLPFALDVLTLEGDRIKEITSFISRSTSSRDPEDYDRFPDQPRDLESASAFEHFGLPAQLD